MNPAFKILLVEDSPLVLDLYQAFLSGNGHEILVATTLAEAREALSTHEPDVVLLDVELPDGSGLDLLAEVKKLCHAARVIVVTAHGSSDVAVEAMRRGAFDFLTKPFDAARLDVTLTNCISRIKLDRRVSELNGLEGDRFGKFIGSSTAMQAVYKTIDLLARSDATGFIAGESGTGKELAVEAIHQRSRRSARPFVAINCAAIPRDLIESELFGHIKGAFTGAASRRDGAASAANGGTLFLDEICEMEPDMQKKLLRFVQSGTFTRVGSDRVERVDIRLLCATNRDPLAEVQAGRFREDLYYRLHVVPVRMPPLRERLEDVPQLARHFLSLFAAEAGRSFEDFSSEAEDAIGSYVWPGNVRQLQNTIQQVVVLNDGRLVEKHMLPEQITSGRLEGDSRIRQTSSKALKSPSLTNDEKRGTIQPLWIVEKKAIEAAIDACSGNVNRAALLLDVAPSTIYRKLQSWKSGRTAAKFETIGPPGASIGKFG